MHYSATFTVAALFASLAAAAPTNRVPFVTDKNIIELSDTPAAPIEPSEAPAEPILARQAKACFIIGNTALPAEVTAAVQQIAPRVKCSATAKTLSGVPDVTSGTRTFSKIDFSKSSASPLQFALDTFATAPATKDSDLKSFQDALDVYTATEAGLRSVGANVTNIKVPKFFLALQIARIKSAQGNAPTDAANQPEHLAGKVIKNAGRVDQSLIDKVNALAKQTK